MTEIVPLWMAILVDCDVFFTPGSARLAIPASQSHALVLPPCDCDARIGRNMKVCHVLNIKGVNFDEDGVEGKSARGGGGDDCTRPGDFSILSSLGFGKKCGMFFWFVQ